MTREQRLERALKEAINFGSQFIDLLEEDGCDSDEIEEYKATVRTWEDVLQKRYKKPRPPSG